MANKATFQGVVRSGPKGRSVYAGSALLCAEISFDPTAASAASGVVLPEGAVIVDIISDGGATGGTNPTVDVGLSGSTAAYANELDADNVSSALAAGTLGTGALTALTTDTDVFVGVGASAATGGTVVIRILYYRDDDLNGLNN